MKKIVLFAFFLGLGIVLFILTIQNIGVETIWQTVKDFRLSAFAFFFAIALVNFVIYTFRWKVLINIEGRDVAFGRLLLHSFAGFMMSYLTPATLLSGEPIRIYLLKKEENIPSREGTVSVITDKVLEITTILTFIFLAVLLALSKGILGKENFYTMITTIVVVAGLLGLFYWLVISKRGFFRTIFRLLQLHRIKKLQPMEEKILHTEHKMANFFVHHKHGFFVTLFLAALNWFIKIFETFTILYFLGTVPTFAETFIITFVPMIALLMPIPGGLGLLEGSTAAIMGLLGMDPHVAVSLILITRIRDIIFVAIGLLHTSHHGIRSMLQALKLNNGTVHHNSSL